MYEITKVHAIAKTRKVRISAAVAGLCLVGLVLFLILGRDAAPPPEPGVSDPGEGFTFFDIGRDTLLTEGLQQRLEGELGSAVKERWANLNLTLNYPGFLEAYFPQLAELNETLKDEAPLRPEETPIKLTFRHTHRKETPFRRVDLVFSSYSLKPMFFRILAKKGEGAAVVETIKDKYGPYRRIEWDDEIEWDGQEGETLVWRHNGDLLLATITPDRYGDPSFHIAIYYMENLQKTAEIKEQNRAKDQKSGAGNAF